MKMLRLKSKRDSIYEIFTPINILLSFCGFLYNGMDERQLFTNKTVKFMLSVIYSTIFVLMFAFNVILGDQEPGSTKSFVLRHGWHKFYLLELLYLAVLIWNNFKHRKNYRKCLKILENFDEICEV